MYIVALLNNKTGERFEKVFYSRKKACAFVTKVGKGTKLTLLSIMYEED